MNIVQSVLLLALFQLTYQAEWEYRVSNGYIADPDESSFVTRIEIEVEVENQTLIKLCTGSLISNQHVLTAKHCLQDGVAVNVYLGSAENQLKMRCVNCWIVYWSDGDIAVITLPYHIEDVQAVQLPSRSDKDLNLTGVNGIIYGWGDLGNNSFPKSLQTLNITIASADQCLDNEEYLCHLRTSAKGSEKGDSGGPLVIDGKLFGINSRGKMNSVILYSESYVIQYVIDIEFFVKVTRYLEWIYAVTGIDDESTQ